MNEENDKKITKFPKLKPIKNKKIIKYKEEIEFHVIPYKSVAKYIRDRLKHTTIPTDSKAINTIISALNNIYLLFNGSSILFENLSIFKDRSDSIMNPEKIQLDQRITRNIDLVLDVLLNLTPSNMRKKKENEKK